MKIKPCPKALWPLICSAGLMLPAISFAQSIIVVDDFSPNGVSPANPLIDYYSSAQVYSTGQITNVWGNWFGGAFQSAVWDGTTDVSNNPASGSLKINLNWGGGSQFVMWDQSSGNDYFALNIDATTYTNFECDVKFAPGSASDTGNGTGPGGTTTGIFGHLRFGDRTGGYGQDWFASVDVLATNTGWVHVSVPLNALTDQNLTNIQGFLIGIDSGYYSLNLTGNSTFWVDNIKFVGASTPVTNPPPVLAIQKAVPGLRLFAGSAVDTYDREELATTDQNQSWVGGTYPVKYSFTLLDYPANIGQTHIMLIPANSAGNSLYNDQFIDYQASNELWMIVGPGGGGVIASVQWKTNLPNNNPSHTELTITNATAVGTWTLTFNSATNGTLTAPGATPKAFTITDPNVVSDFGNPLVAYFGLQPNSTAGEGEYEDWAAISVSGVAGTQESDDFTTEQSFDPNNYWSNNSSSLASVQLVTTNTPYWVNWTLPAGGYALGTAMSVTGNTNTVDPWMLPEYYNGYNGSPTGDDLPGLANQGLKAWVLIPTTCLPTVDGSQLGVPAPNAFFQLFNPPLSN